MLITECVGLLQIHAKLSHNIVILQLDCNPRENKDGVQLHMPTVVLGMW